MNARLLSFVLLLSLLLPVSGWAAIAVSSSGTASVDSSASPSTLSTLTITAGSNLALFAAVACNNGAPTSQTVVWNSTESLSLVLTFADANFTVQLWKLVNPTIGNRNLVSSWATSTCMLTGVAFSGVDQTTPVVTAHNATASGTGTAADITVTSASGDATLAVTTNTAAYYTGQTQSLVVNHASGGTALDETYALGGSSNVHGFTLPSAAWITIGIHIAQVAAGACTTTTANLLQTTVQTAINNATAGDTICLPTGTQTWTTTSASTPSVTLNKGVTLLGTTSCTGSPVTCVDGTVINDGTGNGFDENMLNMTGTNARVSGISFKDPRAVSDSKWMVQMRCASCRFDHNSLTQTNSVLAPHGLYIYSTPTSTQLADHNYLKDLNGAVDIDGGHASDGTYPGDYSWATTLIPGSVNAAYIEDNNFDFTAGTVLDGAYDSYAGARIVFRFNTVKSTNMGGHGLDSGGLRSNLQQEVYKNTITNLGSALYTWFQTRGGLHYVWGNTISASAGSYNSFMWISNYRSDCDNSACGTWGNCDGTSIEDQNTTGQQGYICRDQVGRGPTTNAANDWPVKTVSPTFAQASFPAYSWANTYKSASPTVTDITVKGYLSDTRAQAYHLINNRDFYMEVSSFTGATGTGSGTLASRPATCTTGVAYWATDQGSWNPSGVSGILYRCSATNTWGVYYTPYTYPHPLQQTAALVAPTGLTIVSPTTSPWLTLIWASNTDPFVAGYNVYCGTVSGQTTLIATITAASAAASSSSMTQLSKFFPTAGTRYCATSTVVVGNVEGAKSSEVSQNMPGLSARGVRQSTTTRTAPVTRSVITPRTEQP